MMAMSEILKAPSAFDFYRFNFRLGPREIVRAVDYFRYFEHRLVAERLALAPGMRVLDLGSGTGLFALYLAERMGAEVIASDVADRCLQWQESAARRVGRTLEVGSGFEVRRIDSREIPFADGSFDRVLNLGSIEHIREDGDSRTAREMARVCKPGGKVVLSIPYAERYVEDEDPTHYFGDFERRYDDAALAERILGPAGIEVESLDYFGEPGLRFSRIWYGIPFALKLPIRHLGPVFSKLFLRRIPPAGRARACGVCITLRKPAF